MRNRQLALTTGLLVVSSLLLTACGVPGLSSSVELSGMVFSDFRGSQSCADYTEPELRPEELSGIVLTFSAPDGSLLGSATTGALTSTDLPDQGCQFMTTYQVELDRADSYQVDFEPPEPRQFPAGEESHGYMYYDGANTLTTQTIDFDTLSANDMTWDFEAPAQFVVP